MKLKVDAKGTIGPEHKRTQNSEARYFSSREGQVYRALCTKRAPWTTVYKLIAS